MTRPAGPYPVSRRFLSSPKRCSMRQHMRADATYEQLPKTRRWTMTYCKAECGLRLELPMPRQRQLADQVHVHETLQPFQAQLLPPRWSAARRSRRSQHVPPRLRQQWACILESHSHSNRRSCGRATGTSSINSVPRGLVIASGNTNAGPESTSPLTSDMYRSVCNGADQKSETGGSSRARPSSSPAISCGTSTRTAHAQLVFPRMILNSGLGLGFGSRAAMIRRSVLSRNRVRKWRSGVLTAVSRFYDPRQRFSKTGVS